MRRTHQSSRRAIRNARIAKRWETLCILVICTVLVCFLIVDSYRFVKGLQYWSRNRGIKQEYVSKVEALRQEHQRLEKGIDDLKHNVLAQERAAREIGYIKPGEIMYKFASEE